MRSITIGTVSRSVKVFSLTLLLFFVAVSSGLAQTTHYDEIASGDLPPLSGGATPPTHTVVEGSNVWKGTTDITGGSGTPQDAWYIKVPAGLRLTKAVFTGPTDDGGSTYAGFFQLNGGGINPAFVARANKTYNAPTGKHNGLFTATALIATNFGATAKPWSLTVTVVKVTATVTSHPSDVVGCSSSVTFTAAGSNYDNVKWQVGATAGGAFSDISGATSTSYSFTPTAADIGKFYRAVFSNVNGSAVSNAAKLNAGIAPTATTHPTSQTVCEGYDLSLAAAASGTPTLSVVWQVSTNGGATYTNIPGATSTTYTTPVTPSLNGNLYRAKFTNGCGTGTTNAATITVKPPAILDIFLSPQLLTATNGDMKTINATVVPVGGCSPVFVLESISSSDADAGTFTGDQANDIQNAATGTADTEFDLRDEISPLQDDRTYLVTYKLIDGTYTKLFVEPVIVPSGIGRIRPSGTNDCGAELGVIPPFTGSSGTIPYSVGSATNVSITIYNTQGKSVYRLLNDVPTAAGSHSVVWDGTNNSGLNPGTAQPDGYYIVVLRTCTDYRTIGIILLDRAVTPT